MPSRAIYVETYIRADLDLVWRRTQRPEPHQRWDLRFHEIDYLPRGAGEPQRFRYVSRPLPGVRVTGTGVSTGDRDHADGSRTSVLRFAGDTRISLIRAGSGYWRYVPCDGGVRFLTRYDYVPGWGRWGAVADRLFRPVMGWATAWSFDRLRLWVERGRSPERSLAQGLVELVGRVTAAGSAASMLPPPLAAAAAATAVLLPPLPGTPAARRCLRHPADRTAVTAPAALTKELR
ncbi:MAG TPA: hypothetical protein VF069_09215 [Streptosporangiaceae bacterium]